MKFVLVCLGGWIPGIGDSSPWIRVDFQEPIEVTGVATQGREDSPMWVTSYRLLYSLDGNLYYYYADVPGTPKVSSFCRTETEIHRFISH